MQLPVPLSLQMSQHTHHHMKHQHGTGGGGGGLFQPHMLPAALEPLPRTPASRKMSHEYIHFTNMTTVMEDSSEGSSSSGLTPLSNPAQDRSNSSKSQLLSLCAPKAPDYGSTIL